MSIPVRARQQTPRAGIYFGIFISVVGCLLALQLILAQLGSNATVLTLAAILLPVLVSVAVAIRFSTTDAYDYFVAGRSIPPLTNGLVVAITALGATGLVTITGLVFFVGFDGLAIPIGVLLGILVIATLIAPYARKDGAYTFAGYLGRRFESRFLRLLLGLTLALPCLLLLVAEFKVGLSVATQFLTISPQRVLLIGTVVVVATVVAGGLRGSTWGNGVAALLALIAITVPAAIVSLELTNIPIPQITHGMLVSELTRLETENGFAARPAAALAIEFPALGLERLVKPSMQMFATIGAPGFLLLMLTIAFGLAALPTLVMRAGTGPSVFEARKTFGWAVAILGVIVLTLPAIALMDRFILLRDLPGQPIGQIPHWLEILTTHSIADFETQSQRLGMSDLRFTRDSALLLLPIAGGLPQPLIDLVVTGVLLAAIVGATSQVSAIANSWAEDVVFAWSAPGHFEQARVTVARGFTVVVAVFGAWIAAAIDVDPLRLFVVAMALAGSAAFPLVVMSVWWKRINQWGALAGLACGFGCALVYVLSVGIAGASPLFGLPAELAAVLGIPAGAVAAVVISLVTPKPEHRMIELVRDIRVPGGETVYDREVRLAKVGGRPKT